MVDVS